MNVYEGVNTQFHSPVYRPWGKNPRYQLDRKLSELHVSYRGKKILVLVENRITCRPFSSLVILLIQIFRLHLKLRLMQTFSTYFLQSPFCWVFLICLIYKCRFLERKIDIKYRRPFRWNFWTIWEIE
jgi:hypothetical protein